ncbi:replication-associated recombination protein A [Fructilactobacillus myrtifloralis]|uniref:Replication-associated recombination protein A n=1 Tax=Fructilactobacillus myrtifloralis TaxID=2940301 RepID=A0ABY5BNA0_9LACO|nr:replication-associated recombination protein A [Fructilactobacillus myrtifloralis]USS85154.1 replication-associated recombination protein A [Fructilactobacillus myrtifloralis]
MQKPLAYRMRPTKIEEIVGQADLVGPGKIINRMVKAHLLSSMILYGPPGTGKTSIASAIAGSSQYAFRSLNAATDTKKDLQIVAEEAKMSGTVVLLLDEIHRLDKTKQDFLLPLLESGQIILIGATTENPYINISPAIRSRTQIFPVHPLASADINKAIDRALQDPERGLGNEPVVLADDARNFLSHRTNGDLRSALNALELAVRSTPKTDGQIQVTLSDVEACLQQQALTQDKGGDAHYNVLSALQKSVRGSDPNAALHYAARLIEAGDLTSLIRRLLVIAYEDVGLANPPAAARAVTALQAAERVGLPEAQIPVANVLIELSLSPKSNSAMAAMQGALADVRSGNYGAIPPYLRDAHFKGAAELGHTGYQYPHNFKNGWVNQQYLPDQLKDAQYYQPKETGKMERAYAEQYQKLWQAQHYPTSKTQDQEDHHD